MSQETFEINTLKIKPAFLLNTDCVLISEYDQMIPIKKLRYFIIIELLQVLQ